MKEAFIIFIVLLILLMVISVFGGSIRFTPTAAPSGGPSPVMPMTGFGNLARFEPYSDMPGMPEGPSKPKPLANDVDAPLLPPMPSPEPSLTDQPAAAAPSDLGGSSNSGVEAFSGGSFASF